MNDPTTGGRHHHLKKQQQQQQRQQQEDRLYNLLSSIGHLSAHGDVPVYAFGTLISTAPPQAIAEHLHQRWLADSNFSHIVPKIVLQMSSNVTVCSQVLSFALRDFNTRHDIRAQSKGMFRNFVRTLIELYPVYRQIDKCLSACLIEPIFHCLRQIVDEEPDDRDLHCLANIFINSGQQLSQLNASECDRLVLACRHWLCSNRVPLEEETRQLLMNVIDLWTYSWDRNLFPDCLRTYYEAVEVQRTQQRQTTHLMVAAHSVYSSVMDRQLSSSSNIPPSHSSPHQMTDSASSSLPSSAMGLAAEGSSTQQTKSLPQSRTSIATLVTMPAACCSSSASAINQIADAETKMVAAAASLPNGDLHRAAKKKMLTRGTPVLVMEEEEHQQQQQQEANVPAASANGDDEDKESAV